MINDKVFGVYDSDVDPLNIGKINKEEEQDDDDDDGLNNSMDVPLEYQNLDVEYKIERLMNWTSRKIACETKSDFNNELSDVVNNLEVRLFDILYLKQHN